MDDAYYFGCWSPRKLGHFLYDRHGRSQWGICEDITSAFGKHLDAAFAPGYVGPYRTGPQVEGSALLTHGHGWTVLSFWDRSADGRGGCNSAFVMQGEHAIEAVLKRAQEVFPKQLERFTFEVRLADDG